MWEWVKHIANFAKLWWNLLGWCRPRCWGICANVLCFCTTLIMQDVRWLRTQSQSRTYVMSYDDLTHSTAQDKTLDCDVIEYTTCILNWTTLTTFYWTTYGNFSSWFLFLDFNHIRDFSSWQRGRIILELPDGLYGLERIPSIHMYIYIYTIIINYTHTIHTQIYIYIHTYIHMSMHMQCQPWIHKPLPAV